ncbi:MAG: DUF4199 domain-containing protein [Bacteroidia bacterium]
MSLEKNSQLKFTLNYGAILGAVFVILAIIFYIAGMDAANSRWTQWLYYAIMIGMIIYAIKTYRDEYLGGAINYAHALGTGVLVVLFGSLIYAVYTYFFLAFVDSSIIEKTLLAAEEDMINRGMSDAEIDQAMSLTRSFMSNPAIIALFMVASFVFFGFIFSLIISLLMKKEPADTFDTETSEV